MALPEGEAFAVVHDVSKFKYEYLDMITPALLDGQEVHLRLRDFAGKTVALVFYPTDFSNAARNELLAFVDSHNEFAAAGCQVVACSTDSVQVHLAWQNAAATDEAEGLGRPTPFPLAGDKTLRLCRSLGILDESKSVARHALFVLSPDGDVVHRHEVQEGGRVDAQRVLALIKSNAKMTEKASEQKPDNKIEEANSALNKATSDLADVHVKPAVEISITAAEPEESAEDERKAADSGVAEVALEAKVAQPEAKLSESEDKAESVRLSYATEMEEAEDAMEEVTDAVDHATANRRPTSVHNVETVGMEASPEHNDDSGKEAGETNLHELKQELDLKKADSSTLTLANPNPAKPASATPTTTPTTNAQAEAKKKRPCCTIA